MRKYLQGICFVLAGLIFTVAPAQAVSFKYNTEYTLSGSFTFGAFGSLTALGSSTLIYDSTTKTLTVDAILKNSQNQTYDLDFILGASRNSAGGLEFAFANGTYQAPTGGSLIGSISPNFDLNIFGKTILQDTLLSLFGFGSPASISLTGTTLYFENWIKVQGAPIGANIIGNPTFALHEKTSTAVPEPMSGVLLGIGLLARNRRRFCKIR